MSDTTPSKIVRNPDVGLSICIATFNRGQFIAETLASIIPQMTSAVELVIVDGASTDNTAAVVATFLVEHPGIRYFCEETNSGVDQDFDKAVGYARGRYVWLMTDDDLLVPSAISKVLKAIQANDDLIVVNAEVANADFSRVLNPSLLHDKKDCRYRADDRDQFFVHVMQCLTFIGSTVIRRELWLSRNRERYYGSLFIHVGVVFQSPALTRTRVIADPLVRIRYGNAMWTSRSLEIWLFKWPALVNSFEDFDARVKQQVISLEPWRKPSRLFQYRAKNAYTHESYRRFFAAQSGWLFRVVAKTISLFPVSIANLLSIVYLRLKRNENLTPMYDLVHSQPIAQIRRWLLRVYDF